MPITSRLNQILKVILLPLTLLMLLCSTATTFAASEIYLVRHAEKQVDGTRDPALTQTGHQRAQWLANWLKGKNVQHIYSTNYQRTQQTVAPLAQQTGLTVRAYDPRQLAQFAATLKQTTDKTNGIVVVVGHSNTTPQLVQLLGGDAGNPIVESEYDRIYHLTLDPTQSLNDNKIKTQRFNSQTK
ncbi:MAG: phosphohistidine phosphatase SixA [Phenylobacterium sp.]|jgi:phosphohistidine phosphatase SixA